MILVPTSSACQVANSDDTCSEIIIIFTVSQLQPVRHYKWYIIGKLLGPPSWYIYNSGQVMDFKSHGFSKTFEKLRIWWKGKRSTSVRPPTPPPHPFSIYYQYFVNLQHDHHLHTNWNLAAHWLFLFSVTDTIFAKWKNASNKISLDFDTVNMFFKNVWHNVETLLI